MRDPIEELESFTTPGLTMDPMPASEVRRRGTRLRRRNTALATVGGVLAVAVIVTPLAVLAGNHNSKADLGPADPSPGVGWRQSVPTEFDLTLLPKGAQFQLTAEDAPSIDDLTLCGAPAFSTTSSDPAGPALDATGARWSQGGSEGQVARTLAVYPDDRAAQAALDALQSAVESCPTGPRTADGGPYVYDTVETTIPGADASFVFSQQVQFDATLLSDLTAYEVVRVGNALYLGSSYTTAGGPQAQGTFTLLADQSAPVVSGMCNFSATEECPRAWVLPPEEPESVTASSATDSPASTALDTVPDGFPLTDGLPSGGLDGMVPSPTPTSCGKTLAKADVVDTARAQWRTVSEIRDRRLMTFASEADAQAYVESIAELYCTVDDLGGGAKRVTETFGGAPFGDFSAIAISHNLVDGQLDPGLVATHVVRVGRAVLLAQRIDEGYTWTGDVDQESQQLAAESKDELRTVVDAMCVFSDAGC